MPTSRAFLLAASIMLSDALVSAQSLNLPPPPQNISPAPAATVTREIAPSSPCSFKIPSNSSATNGLPNAPSTIKPLSSHCKFEHFLHQTYSPYTFASAAYEATWAQLMAQWPQYGGGMQGWAKRLGATLADTESRRFIQGFLLSTAFHEDPRYFPSSSNKLLARAWYAATRVLITRSDSGESEVNKSELFGALSTSSLENAYYPRAYRTFGGTMSRFEGALGSDATSNLLHEFTPDLKRLFHKHAPKKIQELEKKVPIPDEDK
jgi:hypothetical protein